MENNNAVFESLFMTRDRLNKSLDIPTCKDSRGMLILMDKRKKLIQHLQELDKISEILEDNEVKNDQLIVVAEDIFTYKDPKYTEYDMKVDGNYAKLAFVKTKKNCKWLIWFKSI